MISREFKFWGATGERKECGSPWTEKLFLPKSHKIQTGPHGLFSPWCARGKVFMFSCLTGFPDGNVYHVQRSHREKRLSLRLGDNEHDAKQVSAQQLDSQTQTDTRSFQYFTLLLLRNSIQEWVRLVSLFFFFFLLHANVGTTPQL